jgi:hypothetical protein
MMLFHYDWWFGPGLAEQIELARTRCVKKHFPKADMAKLSATPDAERFCKKLEHRIILYLRDGFTYEVAEAIEAKSKSCLLAECIPGDEAWQTGVFVVAVPYEEIARVEVFAVHPQDKPQESTRITGFHHRPEA